MISKLLEIYKKYNEIINYVIVGGFTTLVSIGSKWLLLFTIFNSDDALELQISIIISWILAVTFAYVSNRIFVFKSKCKSIVKEMSMFYSSRILTLLIEMALMWFFVTLLKLNTDFYVMIITIIVQVIIMILNYILSKLLIFKKK